MNAPTVMKAPRPARREIKHRTREALSGYTFVIVWIVGFAVFTLWPLAQTLYFSLNQVTISATGINLEYIQWQNYTRALFTDPTFVQLLIEYAIETLVSVPIIIIFSMIIALFLNLNFRFKGVFRTIFFLPVVITSGPVIQELVAQGTARIPAGIAALASAVRQLAIARGQTGAATPGTAAPTRRLLRDSP